MTKTVRKKQYKGLRGVLTACIALALVLCGGMLMKSTTSANAAVWNWEHWSDGKVTVTITDTDHLITEVQEMSFVCERRQTGLAAPGESAPYEYRSTITGNVDTLIDLKFTDFKVLDGAAPSDVGTGTWVVNTVLRDAQALTMTCRFTGEILPLPSPPVKEGYTFTGWYTDEARTQKYEGTVVRDNMTLYDGWQINRYTITFDSGAGSAVDPIVSDYNTTPDLPTPTRIGYNFVGWYVGDTAYNNDPLKADVQLVAHWEIQTFTVTFMVGDSVYKELTVTYGTSLQAAMQAANLAYMYALNDENQPVSKSMVVTDNVTVPIGEMTQEEKIATWIGNNWWVLCVAGGAIAVLVIALIAVVKWR